MPFFFNLLYFLELPNEVWNLILKHIFFVGPLVIFHTNLWILAHQKLLYVVRYPVLCTYFFRCPLTAAIPAVAAAILAAAPVGRNTVGAVNRSWVSPILPLPGRDGAPPVPPRLGDSNRRIRIAADMLNPRVVYRGCCKRFWIQRRERQAKSQQVSVPYRYLSNDFGVFNG
jgi:hypothetical protein